MDTIESLTISVLFLIFYALSSVIASSDTLVEGNLLDSSTHLISANKNFTLGFYSPGNSNNSYLAIWYTNDANHPVWVGNRNTPIYNQSGFLAFDSNGNLIIQHGGNPIELYVGQTGTNTSATLLDSGNFVVRKANSSGSPGMVLWESFDYPTDTLLPGMKLGVNHRTGRNWSLTSWLAEDLPASGAFSLEWDPWGRRLIVRRRGVIYWTSGVLKDKAFENMLKPDPTNFNYDFFNVTNKDEEYFTYKLMVDPFYTPEDRKIISGWLLDYWGPISDHGNRPMIVRVDLCYGYKTQGNEGYIGCELWVQPKCRNHHQKFELRSAYFPNGHDLADNNSSISLSDCRATCWNDCDCVGFTNPSVGTGCIYWRGKSLKFIQDYKGLTVRKYVLISETEKSKKPMRILLSAIIIPVFMVLLLGLLFYLRKKIRSPGEKEMQKEEDLIELLTLDGYTDIEEVVSDGKKSKDLKLFSYECITAATSNFSSESKLGEGGYGPVYKGKLPLGQEIAVKRLSRRSGQGLLEFKNELILIAKLQHVNLIRLLGCCIHGDEKMLIYEYMPNKSLDFFLFDPIKRMQLTWERRFNIIEGIAQGLLYLHKYSRLKIIHRDLKAGNILLDENMNPKISDFGMARIFKQNGAEANTKRIVGTYGYMAPEYAMEGIFSVKSDVFSFGVLLLEIVSGRKNNSFHLAEGPLNLVGHAWELWNKDAALELMDPTLSGSCNIPQLLRCIHVGFLCVEDSVLDRPTMSGVMPMLTNDSIVLPIPKKPAFVTRSSEIIEKDLRESKPEKYSVNGLSLSAMDAR